MPRRQLCGVVTPLEDMSLGITAPWPEGQSPFFTRHENFASEDERLSGNLGASDVTNLCGGWPKVEQISHNFFNQFCPRLPDHSARILNDVPADTNSFGSLGGSRDIPLWPDPTHEEYDGPGPIEHVTRGVPVIVSSFIDTDEGNWPDGSPIPNLQGSHNLRGKTGAHFGNDLYTVPFHRQNSQQQIAHITATGDATNAFALHVYNMLGESTVASALYRCNDVHVGHTLYEAH